MKLTTQYMSENDCYKAGKIIKPKGIMVHSTGCGFVPAAKWYDRWNKTGVAKCVHAFVDDTGVWQYLPWNYRGWHAGSSANNTHISFEICEPADIKNNGEYTDTVYRNAVELTVYLCKLYGLSETDVICHSEGYTLGIASNHADVMHWFPLFGKDMDIFRSDVALGLAGNTPNVDNGTSTDTEYTVVKGDTLIKIAKRYGLTYEELAKYNNIQKPYLIFIGQKLQVGQVIRIPDDHAGSGAWSVNRLLKRTSPMMGGEDVFALQSALLDAGYNPGKADAVFGDITRSAVLAFQRDKRLQVDGIAGKQTITALGGTWEG